MPKINHEEYEKIKLLPDYDWNWIAREKTGKILSFTNKPAKTDEVWKDKQTRLWFNYKDSQLFQFIQWEDGEPYNISELIEEYEKDYKGSWEHAIEFSKEMRSESEETEVKKDKTWAMNQVNNLDGVRIKGNFADFTTIPKDKAIRIISDMDEPKQPKITLQDVTDKLWELPLNNRKLWLARLNDEFQEGYIVPLGLKTTDGEEQYLTYNGSYFASRRNRRLQQTFATLEEIPEFYRGLAERVL